MTDDEIDAVLIPMLAKHIKIAEFDCRILPFDRIAFRAGMREAARIAREELNIDARDDPLVTAGQIADAIERAAGGEG